MSTMTGNADDNTSAKTWIKRRFSATTVLEIVLVVYLIVFVVMPLISLILSTFENKGVDSWIAVFSSNIAKNLFWIPFKNTLIIGIVVSIGAILLGGFMAWIS